jgi:hypothetical protein
VNACRGKMDLRVCTGHHSFLYICVFHLPNIPIYHWRSMGTVGDELLAKHLNAYLDLLVNIVSSQGGEVFKFAGDAIIGKSRA